ncbi:DNA polymerase subunit Cdc27 [Coniella lustricola]|uniref:DNA polymerase delta subunit 3 n=1 Tax=Coniella lustricola TaxID=2025994 RepID=A0A2T3ABR7_9PEZI|nr:DNA polymerase subunit Cdc27 [Coniella lustricola]
MDDYKRYLAELVISENKTVTYRSLSRGLKVHVNTAKQMLYEFHGIQNKKQPGSVHATYMLYGIRRSVQTNGHTKSDEDVEMGSSPPEHSPILEAAPVITLSLVTEESLQDVLCEYEQVKSIHVYSIGSQAVKDLQVLSDVSRPASHENTSNSAPTEARPLGVIGNSYVQRRERRGPAQKMAQTAAKAVQAKPAAAKSTVPSSTEVELKAEPKAEQQPLSKDSTPVSSGSQKPATKRGATGGIMQSFAKAASKPKRAAAPRQKSPPVADNSSMLALSDDGEDDNVAMPEPKKQGDTERKSRKDRQEELKRMMEESSEDEEAEEESEKEDTRMEEPEEEQPAPEPEVKEESGPPEVISSSDGGRRRGKRRVMKKKTIMDEQGYLVTVQEAGWESFSEDEPASSLPKKGTEKAAQPTKPKKAAPKGQGNIMSFFGKK